MSLILIVQQRLKERSTWLGLFAAAGALGVTVTPETQEAVIQLITGLCGLFLLAPDAGADGTTQPGRSFREAVALRLQERSTWLGLVALATTVAVALTPTRAGELRALGVALAGLIAGATADRAQVC